MHDDRKTITRGMRWALAGLVALFIAGFVVSFFVLRARAKSEIAAHTDDIQSGVAALTRFDFRLAARQFKLVVGSSSDAQLGVASNAFSLFMSGRNPVGAFIDFAKQLSLLSDMASSSRSDLLQIMPGAPRDGKVSSDLASLADIFRSIDGDAQNLASAISLAGNSIPGGGDFLALISRLHAAETFLGAFRPWFTDSSPHHLLVLFQNPAELRPAGGFLGSYADVTVADGAIESIAVHDVADVDAGFTPNIVPPKPLQLEVSRWRPADANWFLDFSTSASQTISFFERSQMYAASGTTFDGVIAASPRVMSDLLSVTGPITVSSSPSTSSGRAVTVFDSADFLVQIQKIVQDRQAQSLALRNSASQGGSGATYPKQILSDLARAMVMRFASSTDDQKQQLLNLAQGWIAHKDVQLYFKNPAFENFVASWSAAGDVYALPQNFEGDYIALASANVNGEKSDLYVSENVNWQSQINLDGTVTDHLTLVRSHSGNRSPYWWYDAPNQAYLQLFTPGGATLTNESGGLKKIVPAPLDYAKQGYVVDPLIAAIESSTVPVAGYPAVTEHQESGKNVFATWSRVAPGSSVSLSFDYTRRLYIPIADGTTYQFIFDKQSGTSRHYTFEIDAPLGYIFEETNLASWTFESGDIPGRLIENLTLKKI